jgi:hypothetical protein
MGLVVVGFVVQGVDGIKGINGILWDIRGN